MRCSNDEFGSDFKKNEARFGEVFFGGDNVRVPFPNVQVPFLMSKSPFISVYNQTLPTKPNLFESLFQRLSAAVPIPNPKVRAHFAIPYCPRAYSEPKGKGLISRPLLLESLLMPKLQTSIYVEHLLYTFEW